MSSERASLGSPTTDRGATGLSLFGFALADETLAGILYILRGDAVERSCQR
jgi:hypothetical protein